MLVSPKEMQSVEEELFAGGKATAEDLMDEAALGIAEAVQQFCPTPGTAIVFAAKGHNGGDAIAAASHLAKAGWHIDLRLAAPRGELKPLTRRKLDQFEGLDRPAGRPRRGRATIVLDGLLGIGASGPLRDDYRALAREVNALRTGRSALVFAVDIPTGVDGDTGEADSDAVVADFTLTIGRVKRGLVADGATNHVGRIALVPVAGLTPPAAECGDTFAVTPHTVPFRPWLRPFDCHKGDAGRIGIVAGSRGFTGAAALCAAAAVRGGAGLVTLFVPDDQTYPITAATAISEVMVQPVASLTDVSDRDLDVLAIGPGGGGDRDAAVCQLIERFAGPAIIDADGLNALARHGLAPLVRRDASGYPSLLTPHPGEMLRLLKDADALGERARCAREFAARFSHTTLLLKGARTVSAAPEGKAVAFNTAATPGMASGGMGDILTGFCAALAATTKPDLFATACLAMWTHARAAERAITTAHHSVESLIATDVLEHFGGAMDDLRRGAY